MSHTFLFRRPLAVAACLLPLAVCAAPRAVDETRPASANGTVEITNPAGNIEVQGADVQQVRVTGTLGEKIERLEITQSGDRTVIKVIRPVRIFDWGKDGDAVLKVVVPKRSALETHLTSADLVTHGVLGAQALRAVSGDIAGDAAGTLEVSTVSGDVRLEARGGQRTSIDTTSGEVGLRGAAGEVSVRTVSGDLSLELGDLSAAHFNSVSGDMQLSGALSGAGVLEAHAVSGDLKLGLHAPLNAKVAAKSLSGDISNCGEPKATRPVHGPGSQLDYASGAGAGQVRLETTSGDISFCAGR